jgi:hypothetical protein
MAKQRKTLEREKIVEKREREKEAISEELYRKRYQSDPAGMERYKERVNEWLNKTFRGIL